MGLDLLEGASQVVVGANINLFTAAASLALLVLEFFATLELEVTHIWSAKWSLMKGLYFANRFLPFVFLPISVLYDVVPSPSPSGCKALVATPVFGLVVCIMLSEVMLYVRLYAISGRKRWLRIFLTVNGLTLAITSTTLLSFFIALGSWGPSPFPGISGCVQRSSSGMILVAIGFCVLLYSGLVAMCLSVYFGIKVYWASRKTNRLIRVFYEDGTYYFISLAVMALINVVGALCLPTRFQTLVGPPQAVLHSVMATRMALRLRDQAKGDVSVNMSADSGIESGLQWTPAAQNKSLSTFDSTYKGYQ